MICITFMHAAFQRPIDITPKLTEGSHLGSINWDYGKINCILMDNR